MDVRLRSPSLPFWVDVRLRSFGERWLAVADLAGDKDIGLGLSARQAVAQALSSLGEEASADLLGHSVFPTD